MSYKQSIIDIQTYYENNFKAVHEIPTTYENVQFSENVPEWIRLNIIFFSSRQITIAGDHPDKRIPGVIVFQIFTPPGNGEGRAYEIADLLIEIFARKQISNSVRTKTETVNKVGIEPNKGKLYQLNVDFPFEIDIRL